MQRTIIRHTHVIPGYHRDAVEAGIRQCAEEHGGRLVGDPSLEMRGGHTELTVRVPNAWWDEWMTVHVPLLWEAQLTRRGVDRWKVVAVVEEIREGMRAALAARRAAGLPRG